MFAIWCFGLRLRLLSARAWWFRLEFQDLGVEGFKPGSLESVSAYGPSQCAFSCGQMQVNVTADEVPLAARMIPASQSRGKTVFKAWMKP